MGLGHAVLSCSDAEVMAKDRSPNWELGPGSLMGLMPGPHEAQHPLSLYLPKFTVDFTSWFAHFNNKNEKSFVLCPS